MADWRMLMNETPFGKNTRQNFRPTNTFDYASGGRSSLALPRVGYLARLHVHFSGTCTVTLGGGTAALDATGPYNAISRVRVQANSGQDIYSVSGYGTYLVNSLMDASYDPNYSIYSNAPSTATRVYAAATSSGANAWEFGFVVPIALNDQSEIGLILLQNEMAVTTLAMEYNSTIYSTTANQGPVLVTGAATATLTGTFTPTIEYFSVPADPSARPDISWLHQYLEFTQPVTAVGDNNVNLLRDNLYLQVIHYNKLNNALNSADFDRVRLVINQSDTPYDFTNKALLQLQRYRYNRDLPTGTLVHDFFTQGRPNYGDERDIINGRATSELTSILTVNSGATLGSNASTINTITRQLVKLASAPTRTA